MSSQHTRQRGAFVSSWKGPFIRRCREIICDLVLTAFAIATTSQALMGQALTGQVSGRVLDPAGRVVGGVSVTVTDPGTGRRREVLTNRGGEFLFSQVLPGEY